MRLRSSALVIVVSATTARATAARADPRPGGFRHHDFTLSGGYGAALTFSIQPLRDDPLRLTLNGGRTWGAGVDLRFYQQGGEGLVVRALYLDIENDATPSARTRGGLVEFGAAYRFVLARGRRVEWWGHGSIGLSGMLADGSRGGDSGLGVATGSFLGAGVDLRVAEHGVVGVSFEGRYLSTWFVPNVPSWVEASLRLRVGYDF